MAKISRNYSVPLVREMNVRIEQGFIASDPTDFEDPKRDPEQDW